MKLRNKVIDWFEQTFTTRLNDSKNVIIIVVIKRLHEEDLSTQLISVGDQKLSKIPIVALKGSH